ncbi:DUF5596 domain-containing protein [Paenarthrobacter sp. Z7-10]|uniref:acyltransferase domain-containing protein n=1 Tax=Paenarthrobacter sp. Z7-10 TaxID=2787635 RepID=UPI0022A9369D|nr:acyltransferase domain-containing protein [Paenarthrobacter sp. Z7-10]MCZ2403805.1 DUF5596 domain-containing protein [Paenarthrobacter sp. Z7-10]
MASVPIPDPAPADVLDWLGVEPADRADCAHLLAGEPDPSVVGILEELGRRLGSDAEQGGGHVNDELAWVEGYLRFAPTIIRWHLQRGIPEDISRATLADFGRNLGINRRVHGRFGLDAWPWLSSHFAGQIHQLGRLQYLLHRSSDAIPGVKDGEWVLGIHIPEAGSLAPNAVARSLAAARPFFRQYFPDQPVQTANCASWLLDPYLGSHLDADSNIVRFARLFTPYGDPVDTPSDAVYFTFRTRSMEGLDTLPRRSSLQRVVLERIEAGGCWQLGHGCLRLP